MFADYHTHSDSSFDSIAPMESMIQASIDMGMDHFCLTDHLEIDYRFSKLCYSLEPKAYNKYQEKVIAQFPWADVRKGIELGLQPHLKNEMARLLCGCNFDFIIASVHYIGNQDPYFPEFFDGMSSRDAYTAYLQELIACLSGFEEYSVVGHICYPSRFIPFEKKTMAYADLADISDELLKMVIQSGHGIEVNTSSYATHNMPVPGFDYVRRYKELGGEIITIGSDAHRPEDMGRFFDQALEGIKASGFRYLTAFKEMQPEFVKI
ncbi:MAG: histidinol-phosphatase HisJ family protein [Bacillota bacterium]